MIAPKASLISTPQQTFSQPSKLSTTNSLYVHQLSQKQFTWPQPLHNQANPRLFARYIPESIPRKQRGQRQDHKTTGLQDHGTTDLRPERRDGRWKRGERRFSD